MEFYDYIKQIRKRKYPRLILGWENGVVKGDADSICNLYDILKATKGTGKIKVGIAGAGHLDMELRLTKEQLYKIGVEVNYQVNKELEAEENGCRR